MDQIRGSMEALSSLQLTKDISEKMDIRSKNFLRNKEVLAVILGEVVAEYKGYSREEIMSFIETDSITDQTEVSPGRTNTRVQGDSAEFAVLNEKVSYFDLVFRAKNPVLSKRDVRVSLHVDVEPQTTYRPGYPIERRGMYYLARQLSAQLSLVTKRTDYGQLEKCYSIFICRDDIPVRRRYSISVYEVANTKETSPVPTQKKDYDLMTLVVIKLGDKVYNGEQEEEGYDLFRFLNAFMYQHTDSVRETLSQYIDFSENEKLWEEEEQMDGLGACIFRDGVTEGRVEGILELLEEYGEIPDGLRQKILSETDLDRLRRWLKLAAKSDSVEEFSRKLQE